MPHYLSLACKQLPTKYSALLNHCQSSLRADIRIDKESVRVPRIRLEIGGSLDAAEVHNLIPLLAARDRLPLYMAQAHLRGLFGARLVGLHLTQPTHKCQLQGGGGQLANKEQMQSSIPVLL